MEKLVKQNVYFLYLVFLKSENRKLQLQYNKQHMDFADLITENSFFSCIFRKGAKSLSFAVRQMKTKEIQCVSQPCLFANPALGLCSVQRKRLFQLFFPILD